MIIMEKPPELLAPLNDWKSISHQMDVLANADAAYFGIKGNFSNRQLAGNFPKEDLIQVVIKVHDAAKKCYLATNIIVYDEELAELHQTIELAKQTGVDAVICNDIALMLIAIQLEIPFHVSTQVNVSNKIAAKFYESLGADRIILARELDLDAIREIQSSLTIPVECFVHGAMCTAVSGRCYFSAEMGGFDKDLSANRGKCQQPCR